MKNPPPLVSPALKGFEAINRYWDPIHQSVMAKILPGEYYVTDKDEMIATVLGSCISACIRDKVLGIGGMNHFMLPIMPGENINLAQNILNQAARYGNWAMEHLINELLKLGALKQNLEVKLFGGSALMGERTLNIGMKNIEFALNYVGIENLSLLGQDLGGAHPRKVIYSPKNGKVFVRKIEKLNNKTLFERENTYKDKLMHEQVEGDIDLFLD